MPLFGNRHEEPVVEQPPQTVEETPNRKGSLFSRRHRSTSPTVSQTSMRTANTNPSMNSHDDRVSRSGTRGGFFSRRRSLSSSGESMGGNKLRQSRPSNDPSIMAARQKVAEAEEAELQADRALTESRSAVRDAREHVQILEREVEEEARLHRIKEREARSVGKSAKGLGRHG